MQDEYLDLASGIAIANSKLGFLEDKIVDKLANIDKEIDKTTLENEKLKLIIKEVIKALFKNKKILKGIAIKSFNVNEAPTNKKIDSKKSLKENLFLLNEILETNTKNILANKKAIDKLSKKVEVLCNQYSKTILRKKLLVKIIKKIKPTLDILVKYTVKSVMVRIAFYISMILGGSPYVVEFFEQVNRLLIGE